MRINKVVFVSPMYEELQPGQMTSYTTFDWLNCGGIFINENISPATVMNKEFLTQIVRGNTNIIDRDDNWNLLLYKEVYHIKRSTPFFNTGLNASRELCLFS